MEVFEFFFQHLNRKSCAYIYFSQFRNFKDNEKNITCIYNIGNI